MKHIKYFVVLLLVLASVGAQAQKADPGKFKSAKDFIKEREENDPNMHRGRSDRRITLKGADLQRVDTITKKTAVKKTGSAHSKKEKK